MDQPVNRVRDPIVQDGVGERDPGVVDPGRSVRQHGEGQVRALQRLDRRAAPGRREDDVVGDEAIPKHLAERLRVGRRDHGADGLEGGVLGHEDGAVGNGEVADRLVGAGQAETEAQLGRLEGAAHGQVAGAVEEELERGAAGEDGVDLVDGDAVAQFDVLFFFFFFFSFFLFQMANQFSRELSML